MSFAKAADELAVTAGAISQHIRVLEDHAGGALFLREGRGIKLSKLGERLYPILADSFARIEDAADLIYRPATPRIVMVSMPPTFAGRYVLPRLPLFRERMDGHSVSILSSTGQNELAEGRVDAAIFRARHDAGEDSKLVVDIRLVAVCSPDLLVRAPVDALLASPLIHIPQPDGIDRQPEWREWLAWQGLHHPDRDGGPRFDQISVGIEAAAQGYGFALVARAFVEEDLATGRLVAPFADGEMESGFGYRVSVRRGASSSARAFADWLVAQ